MPWQKLVLALIRCELKACYNATGWKVSAKGALPVLLFAALAFAIWSGA